MSFEDQLGALATRVATFKNDLEASVQHAQEILHKRIDTLESGTAGDFANFIEKLQELEDGIVRHRDSVLAELRDLSGRVRDLESHLVSTVALGAILSRLSALEDKMDGSSSLPPPPSPPTSPPEGLSG